MSIFIGGRYEGAIHSFRWRKPIPVAARYMAWVFGCLLARNVGSNPTGVVDECLLRMLWVVRLSSLRRADHQSKAVLPSVMCLSVFVKARKWGWPGPLGLLRHKKEIVEINRWELLLKLTWIYLATGTVPCNFGRTLKTNCTIKGTQNAGALDFHESNKFWFFRTLCTLYANILRPCFLCYWLAELVITCAQSENYIMRLILFWPR